MYGKPFRDIAKPDLLFEIIEKYENNTQNSSEFVPYNIMCDHTRFDERFPFEYMAQPVVSLSMIRHPFTHLQSAFRYFGIENTYEISGDFPLYEFLRRVNATGFDRMRRPRAHVPVWVRNAQMYTFGYPHWNENDEDLAKLYVKYIDCKFDVVFPLERFYEALILLRRRFHWKIRDILHFHNNKHSVSKDFLPKNDSEKMNFARRVDERLNRADYILYNHFAAKFQELVSREGDDFQSEVRYFRSLNANVTKMCKRNFFAFRNPLNFSAEANSSISRSHVLEQLQQVAVRVEATDWHESLSLTHVDCRLMMLDTLEFQNAFRVRQFAKACDPESPVGPRLRPVKYMHHVLGPKWCANDTRAIYNFPLNKFMAVRENFTNWSE